jgi:hypothetical protein
MRYISNVKDRLKGTKKFFQQISFVQALLATCFTLVSCLAYSSTLMMEATCFPETSTDFQRITLRYIPEDRTLHIM